jgi:hypothetical protein
MGWVYCAKARIPRPCVLSGSRQVADRHGCPASPTRVTSAGRRILLIRTVSWPSGVPSAPAVSTRSSVPDGPLAVTADLIAVREPFVGLAGHRGVRRVADILRLRLRPSLDDNDQLSHQNRITSSVIDRAASQVSGRHDLGLGPRRHMRAARPLALMVIRHPALPAAVNLHVGGVQVNRDRPLGQRRCPAVIRRARPAAVVERESCGAPGNTCSANVCHARTSIESRFSGV